MRNPTQSSQSWSAVSVDLTHTVQSVHADTGTHPTPPIRKQGQHVAFITEVKEQSLPFGLHELSLRQSWAEISQQWHFVTICTLSKSRHSQNQKIFICHFTASCSMYALIRSLVSPQVCKVSNWRACTSFFSFLWEGLSSCSVDRGYKSTEINGL